jgi:hypothetical protein
MRLHAPFLLIYGDAESFVATAEKSVCTKEAAALQIKEHIIEMIGENPDAGERLSVGKEVRVRFVTKSSDEPTLDVPVTALEKKAILLAVQGESGEWLDAWLFTNMAHTQNYDRVIKQDTAYYVPIELMGTDHSDVRYAALMRLLTPGGIPVLSPGGAVIGAITDRSTIEA